MPTFLSIVVVTAPLPADACPRKAEALETHFVDDQFVVYETLHDKVHYLNPTAALIFELCDGAHSVSEIIQLVRDAYDLPEAPEKDVMTCLTTLHTAGIVS